MSIKLRFEKGSLVTQVTLKDEALTGLLKMIGEYQSDDVPALPPPRTLPSPRASALPTDGPSELASAPDSTDPSKERERTEFARDWMAGHSAGEVLTKIGWANFPERILVLGALLEAKGNPPGWRNSDIETQFKAAREAPPSNFARDISAAIKLGLVATETPRTYRVSKTGWLKLYEVIIAAMAAQAQPSKQPE